MQNHKVNEKKKITRLLNKTTVENENENQVNHTNENIFKIELEEQRTEKAENMLTNQRQFYKGDLKGKKVYIPLWVHLP